MIIRAPLKTDPAGKCTRWRLKIYNAAKGKPEWHTVHGTLKDAQAHERELKGKLANGTFIARKDRKTVQQVYDLWLDELTVRGRRTSTLGDYVSTLSLYVLPTFGPKEIGSIRKEALRKHFVELRKTKPAATVNKAIRAFKALLNYAVLEAGALEHNPLTRFKQFTKQEGERSANRGVFTEVEMQAILAAAKPREAALIGLLVTTGLRPGEVYALDWQALDLKAGKVQIRRSWDHRKGGRFVAPKTNAGNRLMSMSPWIVEALAAHRAGAAAPEALVFATRAGTPFCPSNVRRDIWLPLKKRAGVRNLDLYSLRHTFTTFARAEGAAAFNVSRALGHAKSTIVDSVYANHTLDSGIAPLSASVTERMLGTSSTSPEPPAPASPASARPRLRVIGGGKA